MVLSPWLGVCQQPKLIELRLALYGLDDARAEIRVTLTTTLGRKRPCLVSVERWCLVAASSGPIEIFHPVRPS